MSRKAVRIAQKVDGPVKVVWTREEDIQQASTGPSITTVSRPALDADGRIAALEPQDRGLSRHGALGAAGVQGRRLDADAVDGAIDFPYEIAEHLKSNMSGTSRLA